MRFGQAIYLLIFSSKITKTLTLKSYKPGLSNGKRITVCILNIECHKALQKFDYHFFNTPCIRNEQIEQKCSILDELAFFKTSVVKCRN